MSNIDQNKTEQQRPEWASASSARRTGTITEALDENPGLTRKVIENRIKRELIWFHFDPDAKLNKYRVDLDEVRKLLGAQNDAQRPEEAAGDREVEPAGCSQLETLAGTDSRLNDQPVGLPNGDHVAAQHWKKGSDPLKRAKDALRKSQPEDLLKMKFWIEMRMLRGSVG